MKKSIFTLIERLFVIAIIASMLLPALSTDAGDWWTTQCYGAVVDANLVPDGACAGTGNPMHHAGVFLSKSKQPAATVLLATSDGDIDGGFALRHNKKANVGYADGHVAATVKVTY